MTELYPPTQSTDQNELLTWLLTGDVDQDRNALLRRRLHGDERSALQARLAALAPFLARPKKAAEIIPSVLAMLLGFGGKSSTAEEMALTASQYAHALGDLPAWSIKRACDRFANASVKPEEVGADHLDRSFPPSTAQLHMVADALVRPIRREEARISAALRGVVAEPVATAEQRAVTAEAIARSHAAFRAAVAKGSLDEAAAKVVAAAREERATDHRRRSLASRMGEYLDAGLDVPGPIDDPGFVSLPMRLALGWTIEEIDGRKVLVAPAHVVPAGPRETQANEMGS